MQQLDPRIVKVSIQIGDQLKTYEGLYVTISGTKYANPIQNECEIKITNLSRETRDYLLTETSPFQPGGSKRKQVIVEAGRVSTGTAVIFKGDIVSSVGGQPPDIELTLKAQTANFHKGTMVSKSKGPSSSLRSIARQSAETLGLTLDFQAQDKQVSNYQHAGAATREIDKISSAGAVSVYIDDDRLVVKDVFLPLTGKTRILNIDTGMVGIPEFTEQGIKVKFLLDTVTTLGGALDIESQTNPAANGRYVIYKLAFEISSRDTPFYWVAEGKRVDSVTAHKTPFKQKKATS